MQALCSFFHLRFRCAVPRRPTPVTLRDLSHPKMGDYVGHAGLLREALQRKKAR
jgi:hypothetical protein